MARDFSWIVLVFLQIFLFPLLVCGETTLSGAPIRMRPQKLIWIPSIELDIRVTRTPINSPVISFERVTFSQHHIIPYETLRDFFNAVMSSNRPESDLREFATGMDRIVVSFIEYLRRRPYDYMVGFGELEPALDLLRDIVQNRVTRTTILTPNQENGLRMIQRIFTWLPGNIFFGPVPETRGQDDPGRGFEQNAYTIVGRSAHDNMWNAYLNMRNYINNPGSASVSQIMTSLGDLSHSIYISTGGINLHPDSTWLLTQSSPMRCALNRNGSGQDIFITDSSPVIHLPLDLPTTPPPPPSTTRHIHDELRARRRRQVTAGTVKVLNVENDPACKV